MLNQNKRILTAKFTALLIFSVLGVFFAFTAAQAGDPNEEGDTYIYINQDTVWHSTDNLNLNKMVFVNPGATLTIEKGAKIKFGKSINDDDTMLSVTGGRLVAIGTQDEPISITSDSDQEYSLIEFHWDTWAGISELPPSFLRYVEIYGGGYQRDTDCPECSAFWRNLIPTAHAEIEGMPAVYFEGGKVHMENCYFHDNRYADIKVEHSEYQNSASGYKESYLEMTNSNFENNVNGTALISNFWEYSEGGGSQIHDNSRVRLKNIWHPGEAIEGDYTIEGSRTNSLIADPAIVIPGILGSATQYIGGIGKMKLDPIFHTYDNLIASFKKNGYTENQNLFEFPYEWRKSNTITADLLKQKIQEIKNETGISKVDLVAHSMGGLVARYCIEELNCQNDVDQLVTLGTPHKGSPKDYLAWEGGELGIDLEEKFIRNLFMPEAYHAGYDTNLQKYIQEKIPSVRELLPDYNYLYDVTDSKMKNYPTGYPKNGFLEDLNSESMLSKLGNVDFTNIVGNIANKESTISKYRVVDSTISGKWEHGMPENFYDTNTNQGIEYGEGDETVPLISSTGISAGKPPVELNSTHGNLPTTAQCEVIEELTAKTDCKYVSTFERIKDVLTFGVLSPIDIQVIAPDGKWIGKNINDLDENDQISGAFYSGYDTENEFLTIPNPIDGEYKILTQGTETGGDYKIEVAKISEPDNSQEAKESVATLEGTASTGQQEEKKIEVQENQMVIPNQDSTPPTIAGSASPDANTNGWNNTDVKVHFEATDNESGVDTATPDVILTSEGANQSATGTAKDKAGNESSATVSGINIDKTAPQTDISLAGDKGNNNWFTVNVEVKFSATDNLSGIENIYYSLDGGNFTKGSSIVIGNEGEHSLKYYSKDKADNQENAKEEKIKIDKTAPVVTIKSPQSKNYLNNLTLSVDYSVNDSAVGPEKITSQAYVDGILLSGKTIDLSLQSLGAHQFNVIASDEAGNESQASKEFKILTNIDAIIANADHYYDLGMIKSLNSKLFLKVKLRIIHDFMEVLMVLQKTPLPARVKNILLENAKRIINNQIGDLINQIQKKKDLQKDINPTAQKLLIESLGYIKI